MKAALWLACSELWARKRHFAGSAALVAAAVALFSATELVSRAREAAVASQIDYLGPSLRLVPAGVTSTELARFELGDRVIPERMLSLLRSQLSPWLRACDGRLLLSAPVDTVKSPIIGLAADGGIGSLASVHSLPPNAVFLGADLARRLGRKTGERVNFLSRSWQIHGILPPLGSAEDLAVVTHLSALQDARDVGRSLNEIRLYAEPGAPIAEVSALVRRAHPEFSILAGGARGGVAERQTAATLLRHRKVVYWLTALAVAIGLTITAYLNAAERRIEMAMLVAMGGTSLSVLVTLVARAAMIGLVGALVGYVVGAGIAIAQDAGAGLTLAWSWTQPAAAMLAAAALSTAAAIPVSVHASYQNHVRSLQE